MLGNGKKGVSGNALPFLPEFEVGKPGGRSRPGGRRDGPQALPTEGGGGGGGGGGGARRG